MTRARDPQVVPEIRAAAGVPDEDPVGRDTERHQQRLLDVAHRPPSVCVVIGAPVATDARAAAVKTSRS